MRSYREKSKVFRLVDKSEAGLASLEDGSGISVGSTDEAGLKWYETARAKTGLIAAVGCAALVGLAVGASGSATSAANGSVPVVPPPQEDATTEFATSSFDAFGPFTPIDPKTTATGFAQLAPSNELSISLKGLQAGARYAYHIHAGTSCENSGGHYFKEGQSDPWVNVPFLLADSTGSVKATIDVDDLPGAYEYKDNIGHTVVVHKVDEQGVVGAKVLCSSLKQQTTDSSIVRAVVKKYPGLEAGIEFPSGFFFLSKENVLSHSLLHLGAGQKYSYHIHEGLTCVASEGHFYTGDTDPWKTVGGTAAADGSASGKLDLNNGQGFYKFQDNVAHAVVVHNADGVKVGCGELVPFPLKAEVDAAPELSEGNEMYYSVRGDMVRYATLPEGQAFPGGKVWLDSNNVLSWALNGLDKSEELGMHIHTGKSCAEFTGAHYWDSQEGPDSWDPVKVKSDRKGKSFGKLDLDTVPTAYGFVGNLDHVVVIHASKARGSIRVGCAELRAQEAFGAKAQLDRYPGGPEAHAEGQVILDSANVMTFLMNKLEPNSSGGLHIHEGKSCDLAGGHFWDLALPDGWNNSTWRSDATGEARGMFRLDDNIGLFRFAQNVGHVVVVHNAAGKRVACGKLKPFVFHPYSKEDDVQGAEFDFSVAGRLERYPGWQGDFAKGRVYLDSDNIFSFELRDLPGDSSGGIHIHSGSSCSDVGPHHNLPGTGDGWAAAKWSSASSGLARGVVDLNSGLLGTSPYPFAANLERTVVVHLANGTKISCATISANRGFSVYGDMGPYIGVSAEEAPKGIVALNRGNVFRFVMSNLPPLSRGGIHIHAKAGKGACEDPSGTGPHWWDLSKEDPYNNVKWASTERGVARGVVDLDAMVGAFPFADNVEHAVTVHAANGTKIGCAVLATFTTDAKDILADAQIDNDEQEGPRDEKDHFCDTFVASGKLAAYADKDLQGEVAPKGKVSLNSDNVFKFEITGLAPDAAGGIHIHAGKSCKELEGGAHWIVDTAAADPWGTVQWKSDSSGKARGVVDIDVLGANVFTFAANIGHAVVVHSSKTPSLRLACTTLGSRGYNYGVAATLQRPETATQAAVVLGRAFLGHTNKLQFLIKGGLEESRKYYAAVHNTSWCATPDSRPFLKEATAGDSSTFAEKGLFSSSRYGTASGELDLSSMARAYDFERNVYKTLKIVDAETGVVVACGSLRTFKIANRYKRD